MTARLSSKDSCLANYRRIKMSGLITDQWYVMVAIERGQQQDKID